MKDHLFACGECGGPVRMMSWAGHPYGLIAGFDLPIPEGVEGPTCAGCGETYSGQEDTIRVLQAFATKFYRENAELREKAPREPSAAEPEEHDLLDASLRQIREGMSVPLEELAKRLDGTADAFLGVGGLRQVESSALGDWAVSILQAYLRALGGHLELLAIMDEGEDVRVLIDPIHAETPMPHDEVAARRERLALEARVNKAVAKRRGEEP